MLKPALIFSLVFFLLACSLTHGKNFSSKDYYIWDNWILADQSTWYRYFLAAPKSLNPEKRHEHAYIRAAISKDKGKNWQDQGPVLKATQDGTWPNHVIWSGSALKKADEILLFFTGRSLEDGLTQKIGMAKSKDGINFSELKMILEPVEKYNYDISDADGIIMAWRDPYVFLDPKDKRWHMFFAAKEKKFGQSLAGIGHAIAQDERLENWQLQAPLNLSKSFKQIEVPNLIYKDGKYYLFVSIQEHPLEKTNEAKEAALRLYRSDDLNGLWQLDEKEIAGHEFYATTFFEIDNGDYAAVAFWSEDQAEPITATPIMKLNEKFQLERIE